MHPCAAALATVEGVEEEWSTDGAAEPGPVLRLLGPDAPPVGTGAHVLPLRDAVVFPAGTGYECMSEAWAGGD